MERIRQLIEEIVLIKNWLRFYIGRRVLYTKSTHVVRCEGHKCGKVWTAVDGGQETINDIFVLDIV